MGILSGMDIERIKDETLNPIVEKFKTDLNSTIGTEDEKPLDFLSKNMLMDDDHFYRQKITYALLSGDVGLFQQTIDVGKAIAINDTHGLVYCLEILSDGATFKISALNINNLTTATGVYNNATYLVNISDYKLKSIIYDSVTDCVFYCGNFTTDGYGAYPAISKFNYNLSSRLVKVNMQSVNSFVVGGNGFVFDIYGSTIHPVIKKYSTSNLGLLGTYTMSSIDYISHALYADGYLYCRGKMTGVTRYSLIKINTSTMVVEDYVGGNNTEDSPVFSDNFTFDTEFIYAHCTFGTNNYIYKVRRSNFSIENKCLLGGLGSTVPYSLLSYITASYSCCYKGFAIFSNSGGGNLTIVDTKSMKFSLFTTLSQGGLIANDDYMLLYNSMTRIQKWKGLKYTANTEYERVE